jgi:phosphoglycolate phosphatase
MSKIFFDLDGTLLDSKRRLYSLFQDLVPASALSFEAYWEIKKNKKNHGEILKHQFSYLDEEIAVFEKTWLEKIELPEWLLWDKPFEGVTEYLTALREKHLLYLVTARQSRERALVQLGSYGWLDMFEQIFVTQQKTDKYDLIKTSVETTRTDWLIGDTGKDIQTGKKLGVKTVAVLSGFMNRERLMEYEPDLIVSGVLDLRIE